MDQNNRAVMFVFQAPRSSFDVALTIPCDDCFLEELTGFNGGRNFLFGGMSSLCPWPTPAPTATGEPTSLAPTLTPPTSNPTTESPSPGPPTVSPSLAPTLTPAPTADWPTCAPPLLLCRRPGSAFDTSFDERFNSRDQLNVLPD